MYPKQCEECNTVYQYDSGFSRHISKGTCLNKQRAALNQQSIEIQNDTGTVTVINNNNDQDQQQQLKIALERLKLVDERNEEKDREIERLKAANLTGPLEKFNGGLYIIQTARFVVSKEPVYKAGRCEAFDKRIDRYEKGFRILYFCICADQKQTEQRMLSTFRSLFTPRTDIGSEFFEGDIDAMIVEIQKLGGSRSQLV